MLQRHRAYLNEMWDLHADREKLMERMRPMRLELAQMRAWMILAASKEAAFKIYEKRRVLKAEFQALGKEMERIDRRLARLSQAIPGNVLLVVPKTVVRNGEVTTEGKAEAKRIPEEQRNWRGFSTSASASWPTG